MCTRYIVSSILRSKLTTDRVFVYLERICAA
jgi:hypothetical protein